MLRRWTLAPLDRQFQGLPDVALVWDAAAAGGGANRAEQLFGDSQFTDFCLCLYSNSNGNVSRFSALT